MGGYKLHLFAYFFLSGAIIISLTAYGIHSVSARDFAAVLFGAAYSVLPDIDSKSSRAHYILMTVLTSSLVLSILAQMLFGWELFTKVSLSIALLVFLLNQLRHRGFIHTIWAGLILVFPIFLVDSYFAVMAFFGYMTHLFIDNRLIK
jgi:membrane-bound metal-dependent hydrolase YbcI (DUF457 family)